ncbi:glucooligosaccharide oxidase [Mycena sp. CBHHK59/15]|nr:glucooligosaccharide oxidase [Mycena sp. CBHHK59/15]
MLPLSVLTLASVLLCTAAQNITILQQSLSSHGVSAVYPTDKNYSTVSQAYNRRFTIDPVAVAYPTSAQQVAAAVAAGAAQNLEVVARSGGHSYIANGLGGNNGSLVVDLSKLKAVTIRSSNNTAIIETGNRLGDVALALNAAGRALPHGTCSYVGIGGHSGYGGFGFTSRAWGLTLDTIKSATVVLANATVVTASASVNSDLFWAIRGASPSFGIVTSIEVQTFKAPTSAIVFQYGWDSLDITTASNAISSFQTFAASNIPPEFGAELVPSTFNATLAPYLKTLPKPSWSTISPGSYINSVSVLAGQPLNTSTAPDVFDTFYTKSLMTPEGSPMSAAAIKAFVTYMANQGFTSNTNWFRRGRAVRRSNSAINAVPLDSTAFAKRDTLFTIQLYASSASGFSALPRCGLHRSWMGWWQALSRTAPANWSYGAYLNYADNRLANVNMIFTLYPSLAKTSPSHHPVLWISYPRLVSIKSKVDPKDIFRFPIGVA